MQRWWRVGPGLKHHKSDHDDDHDDINHNLNGDDDDDDDNFDVSIMNNFQKDEGGFTKKWDGNQGIVREL